MGRSFNRMLILCVSLFSAATAHADFRHFEDATLHAVQFVDPKEGWAVGDEGVVLHTIDGGQTWERQPTGVRASLRGVHFHNPFLGWAVGREEHASGGSVGVMLFTKDGGLTWTKVFANSMPGLNAVKFTDAKTGFLLGDGLEPFTSGLFKTVDGGQNWDPVPGQQSPSWRAGDFQDGQSGLLGGAWSRLGAFQQNKLHVADDLERMRGRAIRGIQIAAKKAIAVGEGGMVLRSGSGGASWGFVDLKLPTEVLACFDFHAVHAQGSKIWIAGRPGSRILHSDDASLSWSLQSTGQSLPLHAVHFVDGKQGWAVGEASTILHTEDAGKTWALQKQSTKRAGVLMVHARAGDVPLDTVVKLAGLEGYQTTALQVCAADAGHEVAIKAIEKDRLAEATRRCGGMTAEALWAFPCPQHFHEADKTALLEFWNQRHAGQAEREMLRQLVLALRIWRPSVVLGDTPDHADPARALVAEAMKQAIRDAADAKAFPEQIETLGLQTWQVARHFGQSNHGEPNVVQDNSETRVSLHGTVRDFATQVHRLLRGDAARIPEQRSFHALHGDAGATSGRQHWMQGVVVAEGDGRRAATIEDKDDPETLKSLRMVRHLTGLADRMEDPHQMFEKLTPALTKLPEEQAAASLYALGQSYARKGQGFLAQEAFLLMTDRYPSHPSTLDAYRWLIRFNSSAEAKHRFELRQFAAPKDFEMTANFITIVPKDKGGIRQASATNKQGKDAEPSDKLAELRAWHRGGQVLGRRLQPFGALHATEPSIQFCLQAGKRNTGETFVNPDFFKRFGDFVGSGPWADAARGELWLSNRTLPLNRPVGRSRLTESRPHLDGVLDDACWRGLKPMMLKNVAGDTANEHATETMFAHDAEFLYVGIRCQHPRQKPTPKSTARERDAVLEGQDRVSLLFDIDRDYSTYYRLEVDRRGQVREDCSGDANWNPRWFVAVLDNEDCWRMEAAIPLGELTGKRVSLDTAWAFNLARILPGQGVQSYSQPANVEPRPEGMALFLFQQDASRAKAAPMPTAP